MATIKESSHGSKFSCMHGDVDGYTDWFDKRWIRTYSLIQQLTLCINGISLRSPYTQS